MISRKLKSKFSYVGYSESGEMARIDVCIGKIYTVSVLLLFHSKKYVIPLSFRILQKYDLIKRMSQVIESRREQPLSTITDKREYNSVRHFPISLSYNDDRNNLDNLNMNRETKYKINIKFTDTNSMLSFSIHNLNELLSSLKDGMLFPGDKTVGFEIIGLPSFKNDFYYWKVKCLLCGRIIDLTYNSIKNAKSCGCTIGHCFDSDEDRFLSHVDKQENIPKELQMRGTLGIDEEPCWLWIGYNKKHRYCSFTANRKKDKAHRYSYKLYHNKDLPSDIYVCHRCDNTSCVNPSHLFEGTQLDNIRDMIEKGRAAYSHREKTT